MRNRIKTLLSAAVICMLAAVSCVTDDDKATSLEAGDAVPVFSVTMNDGSVVTTDSLRGHLSLIAFFKHRMRRLPPGASGDSEGF